MSRPGRNVGSNSVALSVDADTADEGGKHLCKRVERHAVHKIHHLHAD
jgi:hypothetical protein